MLGGIDPRDPGVGVQGDRGPVGFLGRLVGALGLERARALAQDSRPVIARLSPEDVAGALRELEAFCRKGAFRIS
ncbi:MAG TPA: hypothetical protein VEB43_13815 [Anaeromyxobacter sp.]|nr:hypothetical protein [Anaeromyxobacter sp.]